MKTRNSVLTTISAIFLSFGLSISAEINQEKSLLEIFRTGKARFIPEIIILDDSLGSKYFFSQIMDIAVDDRGFLYVCDAKEGNIKKFDSAGSFQKTIGRTGQGPGDFNFPVEVEWSKGHLFVRELMNRRVSILDDSDRFVKSVQNDTRDGQWQVMKALPDGRILIQKEKLNLQDITAPQEISIDLYSSDLEFIKTIYRRQVQRNKYITKPVFKNIPVPFAPQVYWDVTPEGTVAIGYSGTYEVEIHDPDRGKTSSFSHPFVPIEVTTEDKEIYFRGMAVIAGDASGVVSQHQGAPDDIIKNTEFPLTKPPFINLKIDAEGNIWIKPMGLSVDKDRPKMDVFDRGRRPLGSIKIESGEFPYWMARVPGGFWTVKMNEDGKWNIIKCRISS